MPRITDTMTHKAITEVVDEVDTARDKYPSFQSPHEGYAVILEEVDELWELVKAYKAGKFKDFDYRTKTQAEFRNEAKQIAAMALRFMIDLT